MKRVLLIALTALVSGGGSTPVMAADAGSGTVKETVEDVSNVTANPPPKESADVSEKEVSAPGKTAGMKAADTKAADTKAADTVAVDKKTADTKAADPVAPDKKTADTKGSESKPGSAGSDNGQSMLIEEEPLAKVLPDTAALERKIPLLDELISRDPKDDKLHQE